MKRTLLCICLITILACEKEQDANDERSVSATQIIPSNPELAGVLGTGINNRDTIRLTSNTIWYLKTLVFVSAGDVLIIEPGTVIKGKLSTSASSPGGGLIVSRGAKILAEGTADRPIVFTSAAESPVSGDWAGVIILGNASSNHISRTTVEGVPSNPAGDATYGGTTDTDDNDNSGILKYVRIEYAGTDNEINGFRLAGVGNGTTIDYVEVYKAKDDAFQFFGGTVNASHLLAVDPLDDLFDTEYGYRGTISFSLGLTDTTRADKSQSNGIESENNDNGTTASPLTFPTYNYLTIIGLPNGTQAALSTRPPSGSGKYGRAAHLRKNSKFSISNSIFLGFTYGLSRDLQYGATGTFTNNYVHGYQYAFCTEVNSSSFANVTVPAGNQAFNNSISSNAGILLLSPFNRNSGINFEADPDFSPAIAVGAFASGNWTTTGIWPRFR